MDIRWIDSDWAKPYEERKRYWIIPPFHDGVMVDPETVGQYTGLKDKDGKKIFEGDICEYYTFFIGVIGVIGFDDDDAMFTFTYDENIQTDFGRIWGKELRIIGTIHDNPELLEAEE